MYRILLVTLLFSINIYSQGSRDFNAVYNLPNDTNKVISLLSLCTQYYDISHDTSLIISKKALEISKEIEYKRGEVESLFRIGNEYFFINNQLKAIDYFNQTIEKAKIINAQYWIARSYRQKASINVANNEFYKAVLLNKKALKIHISMNDSANQSQCYSRIGVYYMSTNNFDSSYIYIKKATNINNTLNDKRALARSFRNLANLYLEYEDLDSSEFYFIKALNLQKKYAKKHELIYTYRKYAELLTLQEKYPEAIIYFNKAISISKEILFLKGLPNIYKKRSSAEEKAGLYKSSYNSYVKYIQLNDSLQYKQDQIELKRKQGELEVIKLKNTTLSLKQLKEDHLISNKNRQKLTIILIIALIVLILLIFNSFKKQDLLKEISAKEQLITKKLIDSDIRKEQFNAIKEITKNQESTKEKISQELHDELGGTLTAIKINLMQLKENQSLKNIIKKVGEIAEKTRQISHNLHPPLLKSQAFSDIIQDYLNHIFNNTNVSLQVTILPEDKINILNEEIQLSIYRIIQDLCSNIIENSEISNVNFQLLAHEKDINLVIEDDRKTNLNSKDKIDLIEERLKIIDGEIETDNLTNSGYTTFIFIPIKTELN